MCVISTLQIDCVACAAQLGVLHAVEINRLRSNACSGGCVLMHSPDGWNEGEDELGAAKGSGLLLRPLSAAWSCAGDREESMAVWKLFAVALAMRGACDASSSPWVANWEASVCVHACESEIGVL